MASRHIIHVTVDNQDALREFLENHVEWPTSTISANDPMEYDSHNNTLTVTLFQLDAKGDKRQTLSGNAVTQRRTTKPTAKMPEELYR